MYPFFYLITRDVEATLFSVTLTVLPALPYMLTHKFVPNFLKFIFKLQKCKRHFFSQLQLVKQ